MIINVLFCFIVGCFLSVLWIRFSMKKQYKNELQRLRIKDDFKKEESFKEFCKKNSNKYEMFVLIVFIGFTFGIILLPISVLISTLDINLNPIRIISLIRRNLLFYLIIIGILVFFVNKRNYRKYKKKYETMYDYEIENLANEMIHLDKKYSGRKKALKEEYELRKLKKEKIANEKRQEELKEKREEELKRKKEKERQKEKERLKKNELRKEKELRIKNQEKLRKKRKKELKQIRELERLEKKKKELEKENYIEINKEIYEISGTGFEDRSKSIEDIDLGDKLYLERDYNNEYDKYAIEVKDEKGRLLGYIPRYENIKLARLIDNNILDRIDARVSYVLHKSKKGSRAKKADLKIEINYDLDIKKIPSTTILVAGDQQHVWCQHMKIMYTTIPTYEAKLLYEIYNLREGEYSLGENDTSYAGLDDLEIDIKRSRELINKARLEKKYKNIDDFNGDNYSCFVDFVEFMVKKYPERYSRLNNYIDFDKCEEFRDIIEDNIIIEKNLYWEDETRISEEEWNSLTSDGYNHWYEICELFEDANIPIDLADENIVSIFGNKQFVSFADLSYGC